MDCEEFKMIRHLHIIIVDIRNIINFEKSVDNVRPEDADRRYVTDVFSAFPDVSFTLEYVKK